MKQDEIEPMITLLFEDQKLELRSAFVGGWLADETNSPMGMYTGVNSVDDSSIALIQLLRAVVKMYVDENKLSYSTVDGILSLCVKEAIKREMNPDPEDNKTLTQHQELLLKIKRKNKRKRICQQRNVNGCPS